MLLRFKEFINEAKIDDVIQKTPINSEHDPLAKNLTHEEIHRKIYDSIPQGNIQHHRWAINQYNQKAFKLEDTPILKSTLENFNTHKNNLQKKRIEQYRSLGELQTALHKVIGDKESQTSEKSQGIINHGSTPVHESPNLKLYHVHTPEASCELGRGMPWCTSATNKNGTPSPENMFSHYNAVSNNRFYIAHLPNEEFPYRKLGIGIGAGEFQDENNQKITGDRLHELVRRNPELKTSGHLNGASVATTTNLDNHIHDLLDNDYDEVENHIHLLNQESKRHLENYKNLLKLSKISNQTPEETHQLINSRYHSIRMNTARNNTNPETLRKLSKDPHPAVRLQVASNDNTPLEVKRKLIDPDHEPIAHIRGSVNISQFSKDEQKEIYDKEKRMDIKISHAVIAHNRGNNNLLSDALDNLDLSPDHLDAIVKKTYYPNSEILLGKIVNHRHFDKVEDDDDGYKRDLIRKFLKKHPNPTEHPLFNQLDDSNKQAIIKDFLSNHPNPTEHPLFNQLYDYNKQDVIKDFLKKHSDPTGHPLFNQLNHYSKQDIITDFLINHPNPGSHPSFKKLDDYGKQNVIYDFLSKQQEPTKHPLFKELNDDYFKKNAIKNFLSKQQNPTEHTLFNQLDHYSKQDVITDFLSKQQKPTSHPLFNQLSDSNKQDVIKNFLKKHPNPTEHPLFNQLDHHYDKRNVIKNFLSKQQKPTEHPLFNQLYNDDKQNVIYDFLSKQQEPTEHPLFDKLYDYNKRYVILDFLSKQQKPTEHQSFNQLYDNNDKQDVIKNFLSNHPNDPTKHPLFKELDNGVKQEVIHNFLTNHRTPESHHLFNRLNDREKGMMLANSLHRDEENRIGRFYRLSPEHLKLLRDVHPELVKRMRSQQYQRNEPLTTPIKSRQRRFNFIESLTK